MLSCLFSRVAGRTATTPQLFIGRQLPLISLFSTKNSLHCRRMATVKEDIPHVVRTAGDQRQREVYSASIGRLEQVNSKVRLIRLYLDSRGPTLQHLPGQYIDLNIPDIEVVGGFTITSPPQSALRLPAPTPSTSTPPEAAIYDDPYIELAIQRADENPPAAYIWRPPEEIMNAPVQLRIGGNFTYPPLTLGKAEFEKIENVVFVAGGVGINPIMSMISAMDIQGPGRLGGIPRRLRILYTARRETADQEVLFEKRLAAIAQKWSENTSTDFGYTFHETGGHYSSASANNAVMNTAQRRITHDDLYGAIGPESMRQNTLVYVCGLPVMTDEFVDLLKKTPGMEEKRVLCEKWW